MKIPLRVALAAMCATLATTAVADITLFERQHFAGRAFTTDRNLGNFARHDFNDRASSAIVERNRWEVCEDVRFGGHCVVLRPGRYASLHAMGLNNSVSSAREVGRRARVSDNRYSPPPVPTYDYRRRSNERVYQADVIAMHAVYGQDQQRCWIEQQAYDDGRRGANVPGAVVGAVLGGILGHQVGGGRGQDIATAGGAVAGAAVGANVGRGNDTGRRMRDVERCETTPASGSVDYWDVTYEFRGQTYQMQTHTRPGRQVTVNARGEPRV